MSATDKAAEIMTALKGVEGIYATDSPSPSLPAFPAAVLDVPDLEWTDSAYGQVEPSGATFHVFVVVQATGYWLPPLEAVMSPVIAALWAVDELVITQAATGTFPQGSSDLPCYIITCEVSL